MKTDELSIGQALAYAIADIQDIRMENLKINSKSKDYLNKIKERYLILKNSPKELENIIDIVPRTCCPSDIPFLKNNSDFFIAFLLLCENNKKNLNTSPHFIKHLNDCYWCFKSYNKFIRDFYYTSQKIKGGNEKC